MNQYNCEAVFDQQQSQLQKKKEHSQKQISKEKTKQIAKLVHAYNVQNMNQKIPVYDAGERTLK